MTKKQRSAISSLLSLTFLALGLPLWYSYLLDIWWMLFVIIVIASTVPHIILNFVPGKKSKKLHKRLENAPSYKGSKKGHNKLRSEKEILTLPLEELSWREFERLCFLYYKAKGYQPKETSEGADGGVDLIIYNKYHSANEAIQIKHRKTRNQVTVKEIRELAAAKRNHKCTLARFITTSSYTNNAQVEADKYKIETHDLVWVTNKILTWRELEVKKRNIC